MKNHKNHPKGADDFPPSLPAVHIDDVNVKTTKRIVLGDISRGRVPYVFFQGSRYYGRELSGNPSLIKKTITLAINSEDIRIITAYLENGQFLDNLISAQWSCIDHPVTIEERRRVIRERQRLHWLGRVETDGERINHHWSMDFVSGSLNNNRCFRILTVIDDFSKECLVLEVEVDHSLTGEQVVARVLERLALTRELPDQITVEGIQEFTSTEFSVWANQSGVKVHFIGPRELRQKTSIERFIYKLNTCLNEYKFSSLHEVQERIEIWRQVYNANVPRVLLNN